jgi:hypothetical protein
VSSGLFWGITRCGGGYAAAFSLVSPLTSILTTGPPPRRFLNQHIHVTEYCWGATRHVTLPLSGLTMIYEPERTDKIVTRLVALANEFRKMVIGLSALAAGFLCGIASAGLGTIGFVVGAILGGLCGAWIGMKIGDITTVACECMCQNLIATEELLREQRGKRNT